MNIIYIHTHDTGRYIQPYGYGVPTTNLQNMSESGVLFRNCFCCNPTCSPSRAAMLSGMSPHSCGMFGLAHRGFRMNDYSKHLCNYFKSQGYETALSGMHHEVPHAMINDTLQYDHFPGSLELDDRPDRGNAMIERDRLNCTKAVEFIKNKHEKPFFLSFGMLSTHRPFPLKPEGVNPDYVLPPAKIPDNPETRRDMAGFIMMAKAVDDCVGAVLQAVKDAGIDDETFIFFTTDHGVPFPASKCTLSDTGTGVALIFKFPGDRFSGQSVDALISHLDVFPTLCEIAGIAAPDWLEGRSILPLLKGTTGSIREEVFSEVNFHAAYEPMRAVRTDRYKLIRHFDDYDKVVLPNIDNGLSKQFLLRQGLADRKKDMLELYDLVFDPEEKNNVAGLPEFSQILAELDSRLTNWMKETNDPLLSGAVAAPEGATVNRKDGLQPEDKYYE